MPDQDVDEALRRIESFLETRKPKGWPEVTDRQRTAARLARAAIQIGLPGEGGLPPLPDDLMETRATWLAAAMIAAQGTVGECRKETPYAPLRPVLTDEGLRWCCLHNPEHCA
jgi:hypothetical protein